jgi:hypothetical protein
VSDFAESLFADLDDEGPEPEPRFYPGSKQRIPDKPTPPPKAVSAKPWDRNPRHLKVNGVEMEFFTIGSLAEALNRRPVTIRKWETTGVIPKARYRTGGEVKRRLYSRAQVEGLVALCAKHGILDFAARPDAIPDEFTDDVIALWKNS